MLIAKTQQESDLFVEQELSHICTFSTKTKLYSDGTNTYCISDDRMYRMPEQIKRIKTKKYGTLAFFDSVRDLIDSKFNKGIIVGYCSNVYTRKSKRTMITCCDISTYADSLTVEDKEFSPSGGLYINNIENIEPQNCYLFIIERNKFCASEVQFIDSFKLKSKN